MVQPPTKWQTLWSLQPIPTTTAEEFLRQQHIDDVIDIMLSVNPDAVMVIKSTINVGYTRLHYVKYALKFLTNPALSEKRFNLLFSPEFLRESKALEDNLYPLPIIVGYPKILPAGAEKTYGEENAAIGNPQAEKFAETFARCGRRSYRILRKIH